MVKKSCLLLLFFCSCSSYEQFRYITEEFEMPSKTFNVNYTQAWQAVLDVMRKYDLEIMNQETGLVKTSWVDNTNEINFTHSVGLRDYVKSARMKIIVNVIKGFREAREVTKVTIFTRQMVEHDFLQGWKVIRSDGILEKTIFYRLERILFNYRELKKIEEQRARELDESF